MGPWTYELGVDPVLLAARVLSAPTSLIAKLTPGFAFAGAVYQLTSGDLGWVMLGGIGAPGAHFPYGIAVEPDLH